MGSFSSPYWHQCAECCQLAGSYREPLYNIVVRVSSTTCQDCANVIPPPFPSPICSGGPPTACQCLGGQVRAAWCYGSLVLNAYYTAFSHGRSLLTIQTQPAPGIEEDSRQIGRCSWFGRGLAVSTDEISRLQNSISHLKHTQERTPGICRRPRHRTSNKKTRQHRKMSEYSCSNWHSLGVENRMPLALSMTFLLNRNLKVEMVGMPVVDLGLGIMDSSRWMHLSREIARVWGHQIRLGRMEKTVVCIFSPSSSFIIIAALYII
ncbi:uncharacterized protein HD556DRAFT_1344253 [Suillus plorans]|uniref:Uncharacterized protein n=1 Tax=Suillus plorans TaxID=116603 RepID=A0A9P7J206_9AGAM|nr:uncharacterized protein HD556DRAFT_1344253 [Suillus plorans]KAG1799687.1 hypothetical protein HD556DRAFT_1344253 [Suillus plorans]